MFPLGRGLHGGFVEGGRCGEQSGVSGGRMEGGGASESRAGSPGSLRQRG